MNSAKLSARLGVAAVAVCLMAVPVTLVYAEQGASPDKVRSNVKVLKGDPVKGRALFISSSCGGCHSLKDAGTMGENGPPLNGDTNLNEAFIIDRVTNGKGDMPAFGSQLSAQNIADIAAYVMKASAL